MPVSTSVACVALLVVSSAGAPKGKDLRNVIITSFGEMPYEPVEGFYQGDAIPVGPEGDENNPTMDVVLRTGILVEDPNEKKSEEDNSAEGDDKNISAKSSKDDRKKTGEELFREFREKHRYAPKKDQKSRSTANQWSPVVPSFVDDFLQPRKKPAADPPSDNGYNIDREYQGDLGEGWNLQDAVEVLQDRNFNIPVQNPGYPSISPREMPPPLLPPEAAYPFPIPSLPLPYPDFNPQRRSRLYPFGYPPLFYGQTGLAAPPAEHKSVDKGNIPRIQEVGGTQLHPTRIGVPYNPPMFFGDPYLSGV